MTRRARPSLEALEGKALLSGLTVSLTTDQAAYVANQPVHFTLTETNTSTKTINIEVGPGNDGFYVTHDGQTVWASNPGNSPTFVKLKPLAPGQSFTVYATWDGKQHEGAAVSATGAFEVHNQQLAPTVGTAFSIGPITNSVQARSTTTTTTPAPEAGHSPLSGPGGVTTQIVVKGRTKLPLAAVPVGFESPFLGKQIKAPTTHIG